MKLYFPGIDEFIELEHLTLRELARAIGSFQYLKYSSELRALVVHTKPLRSNN